MSVLVPALRDRGFEPEVIVIREKGQFFDVLRSQGIPTRFVPVRSRFDLRGVRRAVAQAGSWPDVVVTQGLDAQLVGHLIARRAKAPHVTVHHKQPELSFPLHRRLLTRWVARRVDRVIAVSKTQTNDLGFHGFPADRVRLIPNGVPEPSITRTPAEVRAELGLLESEFVALLAARLRPEKQARVFVDAVIAAHDIESRVRGLVAGYGPDLDEVRARAQGSDAVLVLGERDDVPDLMGACDVVCLTSSAEALPMVVLEAMAMGRPVVATDVGGVADVVGVESGVILPIEVGPALSQTLCNLVNDPGRVRAMGAAARSRYVEQFSSELMADRYAEALGEVLSGS